MKEEIVKEVKSIVGDDWVIDELDQMRDYLVDETPESVRPVSNQDILVAKPKNTEEISKLLKFANEESIPVIPRGAGTGLCGAAVPTRSSIILSMERLDEIEGIDKGNLTVTCQAGVTLEDLYEELQDEDSLFFPPHPGDEGAQIGGVVVENAGGARAVKYGVIRDFVRKLEVVLPTGEVVEVGRNVVKNNTGLDLRHLFVGSEGILGILTKATLKLYPRPEHQVSLVVPYDNRHDAINTVPDMLMEGITPLAIEYMERDLVERSCEHAGKGWPVDEGEAYLYIIVTGNDMDEIYSQCERIGDVCKDHSAMEVQIAERRRDQENILDIRSNIYTALEPISADILDVTVPPARIGDLMDRVDEVAEKYDTHIPAYGHVADGNLHPHIMLEDGETPPYLDDAKEEIYRIAMEMGGVITGEHGIGKTRLKNLPQALDEKQIELMKGIKRVFDPNNIINPGTVVDINED